MNGFVKSLTKVLGYLGRGAVPVDGMYWDERARPARAAQCQVAAGKSECSVTPIRTGYRTLM